MREMVTNASLYKLAIVTALPKEFAAIEVMLNQHHDIAIPGDPVHYTIGIIGPHPVVVILLPKMGNNLAVAVSSNLLRSFPNIKDILMVGIAGGVPDPKNPENHVRLGDIVLSTDAGVVQFDFSKFEQIVRDGEPLRKSFTIRASYPPPSARLQQAIRLLEARRIRRECPWEQYIALAAALENVARPPDTMDILYASHAPNSIIPQHEPEETIAALIGQKSLYFLRDDIIMQSPTLRTRMLYLLAKAADCRNIRIWLDYFLREAINLLYGGEILHLPE